MLFEMKKSDLKVIKEGQTGYGILIEQDGYMDVRVPKALMEDYGNERKVPNPFVLDCVFQKFGVKNANGRIYPEDVLRREAEKYQSLIRERMALGELNHPQDSTIDLGRISHNIIEMHWEGRTLVGKIELNVSEGFRKHGIVSTCGDHAANLLLNGYKFGVSSRGLGSVEQRLGQVYVGDDFQLVAIDIVATPSTPGAYVSATGTGDLEQYIEGSVQDTGKGRLDEKLSRINAILNG